VVLPVSWRRWFAARSGLPRCGRRPARPHTCRPRLEELEQRLAPATVTTDVGDGQNTLAYAVAQVNTGQDSSVDFEASGIAGGVEFTQPVSVSGNLDLSGGGNDPILSKITFAKATTISGLTLSNGTFEVDGAASVSNVTLDNAELLLEGGSSTVSNVTLTNSYLDVAGGNNTVTNVTGTTAGSHTFPDGATDSVMTVGDGGVAAAGSGNNNVSNVTLTGLGLTVDGDSNTVKNSKITGGTMTISGSSNTVQGNTISGSSGDGLKVINGTSNTIGGTSPATGNTVTGNAGNGIRLVSPHSLVEGNSISGNTQDGLDVIDASGNTVGSTIGGTSDSAANTITGNSGNGIVLESPNNLVEGNSITGNTKDGLDVINDTVTGSTSSGNTIGGVDTAAGNVISGNTINGVSLQAPQTTLENNFIGTDRGGSNPQANQSGVIVSSDNNSIGMSGVGNVISGNTNDGIHLDGSNNLVVGNFIGTNASGASGLGNGSEGLHVSGSSNSIGGTTADQRNVISGNGSNGIEITEYGDSNLVGGNYIGVAPDGTDPLPNKGDGVYLNKGGSNTIGGDTGNVISANGGNGIHLLNTGVTHIDGNDIGMGAGNQGSLGNSASGIYLDNSSMNDIGTGSLNYIANNAISQGAGVLISGTDSNSNRVQSNYIQNNGGSNNGQASAGGGSGVLIAAGSNNLIGGTADQRNVITGNAGSGVLVDFNGSGNSILSNTIYGNAQPEISISGANNDQAAPTLQNASYNYLLLQIQVNVVLTQPAGFKPNTTYTVQFFGSDTADAQGGPAKVFLGSDSVTTDSSGFADEQESFTYLLPNVQYVSATATDPNGNTSPFSLAVPLGGSGSNSGGGSSGGGSNPPPPGQRLAETTGDNQGSAGTVIGSLGTSGGSTGSSGSSGGGSSSGSGSQHLAGPLGQLVSTYPLTQQVLARLDALSPTLYADVVAFLQNPTEEWMAIDLAFLALNEAPSLLAALPPGLLPQGHGLLGSGSVLG
jgi:hypothetical protein